MVCRPVREWLRRCARKNASVLFATQIAGRHRRQAPSRRHHRELSNAAVPANERALEPQIARSTALWSERPRRSRSEPRDAQRDYTAVPRGNRLSSLGLSEATCASLLAGLIAVLDAAQHMAPHGSARLPICRDRRHRSGRHGPLKRCARRTIVARGERVAKRSVEHNSLPRCRGEQVAAIEALGAARQHAECGARFRCGLVGSRALESQCQLREAKLEQPVAAAGLAVVVTLGRRAAQDLDLPVVQPKRR